MFISIMFMITILYLGPAENHTISQMLPKPY